MIDKIKAHKEKQQRVRILRKVSKGVTAITNGYILDFSDDLLLIHESDDFKVEGFAVIPINQIKKIRFNKSDKYFNEMMIWEREFEKVGISYSVDLTDWQSVFESVSERKLNVIVECEGADTDTFTIGPIVEVGKKSVDVLYFDTEGYFENTPSAIHYNAITRVAFDNQYINTFSKYTRHKKSNLKNK